MYHDGNSIIHTGNDNERIGGYNKGMTSILVVIVKVLDVTSR